MQPLEFTREDAELLFGPDADYKAAFEELDTDEDGEVRNAFCFMCLGEILTLYTITLIVIFSMLFALHFSWYWQGEFVGQSRGSLIVVLSRS